MTARLKLSELIAARAAMSVVPIASSSMFYRIEPDDMVAAGGADAEGIVATHNAADVLIEIARAALEDEAAFVRHCENPTEENGKAWDDTTLKLRAVLAEVEL